MKKNLFALAVLALGLSCKQGGDLYKISVANRVEPQVVEACERYGAKLSNFPPAPHGITDAPLVRSLAGDNPKKIALMKFRADQLDKQGNLVDPWGRPYHIFFNESGFQTSKSEFRLPNGKVVQGYVFVWSEGPNGNNEGGYGDDVRSW